jgi:non-ribosomal peptide synthetase component F
MTLLAGFTVLVGAAAGTDDVVVGGTAAGRTRPELEDLIGLFVNPIVLRTDLSGDPTFVEVLDRVRRTVLDAFEHQDAPFDKVVERVAPPRDLGRNPVVQVAFEYQDLVSVPDDLGGGVRCTDVGGYTGAEYGAVEGGAIPARLDIELFVAESPDGSLGAALVYATDLYDRPTMAAFGRAYGVLLEAVAGNPQARLAELAPIALRAGSGR